jgi:hypothetical protein
MRATKYDNSPFVKKKKIISQHTMGIIKMQYCGGIECLFPQAICTVTRNYYMSQTV